MVKNEATRDCVPIVEGKRGCVMHVMSPPAQNNVLLGTAYDIITVGIFLFFGPPQSES